MATLDCFAFGDSPEMADELLRLVLAGKKTATCGPLREYEAERVPLPKVGERSIALDGRGKPACIIETTAVRCTAFEDVDADFARAEGEGDQSLAAWQDIHREFFRKHGGYTPDMILVCRNFRIVERLP